VVEVDVELRAGEARGALVGACGWPSESWDTGAVTPVCGVSWEVVVLLFRGADVVVCLTLVM